MAPSDVALLFFATCSSLRLAAYVPQIIRRAQDRNGTRAIFSTR